MKNEHPLAFYAAQLRHAYKHLRDGRPIPGKHREFADGLIAPAIRAIERHMAATDPNEREPTH